MLIAHDIEQNNAILAACNIQLGNAALRFLAKLHNSQICPKCHVVPTCSLKYVMALF